MLKTLSSRLVVALAKQLVPKSFKGPLHLTLPSGQTMVVGGQEPGETADLKLKNFRVLFSAMRRAQLGFFERYISGDIESRDPTAESIVFINKALKAINPKAGKDFINLFLD